MGLDALDAFVTATMWGVLILVVIWVIGQLIGAVDFK